MEYIEPYAGGASVGLSLLFEEYASHIHINDINRSVYAFWKAVLESPDELCNLIASAKLEIQEWERQRAIQEDKSAEQLDLAFSTFYLNRTTRSGILRGGVIGGKKQEGTWKLDARFNKPNLIRRIQKIARFASRITVSNIDAAHLIADFTHKQNTPSFLYLDPPYYAKGQDLYQNFYTPEDHKAIAKLVSKVRVPWIVSYDAVTPIAEMYRDYSVIEYGLKYSASRHYSGNELMFFSHDLLAPSAVNPTSVRTTDVNRLKLAGLTEPATCRRHQPFQ